jgi:hypothetical protein
VQADFPARKEFEMFDRVGDVTLVAIDAGIIQRAVEHLARRPDKGMTGEVLLVTGLFADQHHLRMCRSFAEHGLRCVFPQVAGAAVRGLLAQGGKAGG